MVWDESNRDKELKRAWRNQWRMVVIVTGCALCVTSHCDVKFTFQIQCFGDVF